MCSAATLRKGRGRCRTKGCELLAIFAGDSQPMLSTQLLGMRHPRLIAQRASDQSRDDRENWKVESARALDGDDNGRFRRRSCLPFLSALGGGILGESWTPVRGAAKGDTSVHRFSLNMRQHACNDRSERSGRCRPSFRASCDESLVTTDGIGILSCCHSAHHLRVALDLGAGAAAGTDLDLPTNAPMPYNERCSRQARLLRKSDG